MAAPGSSWVTPEALGHHKQHNVCHTRPKYREGRRPKAVKVYTINLESRYVLVQGVPAVGAMAELVQLFALYGTIGEYRALDEYPAEQFTEVYLITFQKLQSARAAKRRLDERSFFGGLLHVCYAPEYETVEDTRQKLLDRKRYMAWMKHNRAQEKAETEERETGCASQQVTSSDTRQPEDVCQESQSCHVRGVTFPLLPPPPREGMCKQHGVPLEDYMGSTYHVPDAPIQPAPSTHKPASKGNTADRRGCLPTHAPTKFIPRTPHLQNKKRKADNSKTLLAEEDRKGPLIGPKLPELPRLDMEDESLNTTANIIRSTMAKAAAPSVDVPAGVKTLKPRRRI